MSERDEMREAVVRQERFEWGEIERELSYWRRFNQEGGWIFRVSQWLESYARSRRQEIEQNMLRACEKKGDGPLDTKNES